MLLATFVVGMAVSISLAQVALTTLFEYNFGDTEVLLMAVTLMTLPFTLARAPAPTPVRS